MKALTTFRPLLTVGMALLTVSATAWADLLSDYVWTNRVLLTFSASESAPERLQLLSQIERHRCEYKKRDLVHVDLIAGSVDYESLSQRFSLSSKDFTLILVGKDGKAKLYTNVVALKEIFDLIDLMPMRRNEMSGGKCE